MEKTIKEYFNKFYNMKPYLSIDEEEWAYIIKTFDKEDIIETLSEVCYTYPLPIGSRWSDYGFDRVITTTEFSKKYIGEIFNESLVHIIPPIISDEFKVSEKNTKPIIAIMCKDRSTNKRIISEFYIKYPHLRWLTFRDMINMPYQEFANNLRECVVSVWVDEDSTFGTFPLESMKSGVPIIGKIQEKRSIKTLKNIRLMLLPRVDHN